MTKEITQIDTSVKIESVGVVAAIIVLLANIIILLNWESLDTSVQKFFRGGHPGGIIVGVSAIVGFCSSLLFIINMFIGKRKFWGLRLLSVLTFLGTGAFIGSMT